MSCIVDSGKIDLSGDQDILNVIIPLAVDLCLSIINNKTTTYSSRVCSCNPNEDQ